MKAPGFWSHGGGGVLTALLSPVGMLYGFATMLRQSFGKAWACPVPVICVGNLIAGGAGKTPVVLDIARRLLARGVTPHVITRGYGGTEKGPLRVSTDRYDARLVGDEPLLISAVTPTWVSDVRLSGCRAAMVEGAMCMMFDDGFQDPSVARDLSLIVVDGGFGFGNGHMIPAGPLREPVSKGLSRANAVILIGEDTAGVVDQVGGRCPVLRARIEPGPEATELQGKRVSAFAGIGRPDKFFDTVREIGCDVVATRAFADHHNFTRDELDRLKAAAEQDGLALVTTEKDWVRIPPEARDGITAVTISLVWDDEAEIKALLEPVVNNAL